MSMSKDITADLAKESEREAKGVSWDLHQRECDRNEALEYEIETLKAKVAELNCREESAYNAIGERQKKIEFLLDALPKIKAKAIREAILNLGTHWADNIGEEVIRVDLLERHADKLEAGTL